MLSTRLVEVVEFSGVGLSFLAFGSVVRGFWDWGARCLGLSTEL